MNIILLSGGSGKRLWPLSNEVRSKQFLKIFRREDGTLNMIPSPIYQTRTLSRFGLKRNGLTQRLGNTIILAPEFLSPINEFGFGETTKNTYSIHHYAATWYGEAGHREKERIQRIYRDILRRMKQSCQEEQ